MIGALLWLVAGISLVFGPVALLLFFLLQFLPYHSHPVAWLQRVAIVADLALLWVLWPRIGRTGGSNERLRFSRWYKRLLRFQVFAFGKPALKLRRQGAVVFGKRVFSIIRWPSLTRIVSGVTTGAVLATAVLIATFPGEWLHDDLDGDGLIRTMRGWLLDDYPGTFIDGLPDGDVMIHASEYLTLSPFRNRLTLTNLDPFDHAKFDSSERLTSAPFPISLAERDLRGAFFQKVDFHNADFTGAQLQFATIQRSNMKAADFDDAKLQGAEFFDSDMMFAQMDDADMQGTKIFGSDLRVASLRRARMQGAEIQRALMQGADLDDAQMQLAIFLDRVNMQGASLKNVGMQGVFFFDTDLRGATLGGSVAWRADLSDTKTEEALLSLPSELGSSSTNAPCERWGASDFWPDGGMCNALEANAWTIKSLTKLKQLIVEALPTGVSRDRILSLADDCLDPDEESWEELLESKCDGDTNVNFHRYIDIDIDWNHRVQSGYSRAEYATKRAAVLRDILCYEYSPASVLTDFIDNLRYDFEAWPESIVKDFVHAILAPGCFGTRAISPSLRFELDEWANHLDRTDFPLSEHDAAR